MVQYNRRHFLQGAAGAVALSMLPRVARADVNSQIRVATIGLNGRGRSHIEGFGPNLVALCDCDRSVLGQTGGRLRKASGTQDRPGRRLPRAVGSQGHRRDFDRHAESHARADRDRGRRGGQARVLRKAGEPMLVGRSADRQRFAAVRSADSMRHAGAVERVQSSKASNTFTAASSARSSAWSALVSSRGRASASWTSRW